MLHRQNKAARRFREIDETLLFVDYGGDKNLIVKTDPYNSARPGDRVNFSFKDEGVRVFDKSSGDSIQL